jgi:hypothetical protein
MTKKMLFLGVCVAVLVGSLVGMGAPQTGAVQIDNNDIGGVVTSDKGPEAGVWVIAETMDLPTRFIRSVVTDDQGRYVVPDLPSAKYEVFVRGYGLVDSPRVAGVPGKSLNLKAVIAPNPRAAAEYYPAQYWFSMINIPAKSEFPIAKGPATQAQFVRALNTDTCISCHQIGNKATREIKPTLGTTDNPPAKFENSVEAWARRVRSGHDGGNMDSQLNGLGRDRALKMFADWTDRIARGEYPKEAPPRPQGPERNLVVTQWEWADPREYFHDIIASDKRNPRINPFGPVYGLHENSSDHMTILDPVKHSWRQVVIPRNPAAPVTPNTAGMAAPSQYWGNEVIWNTSVTGHSNEMDQKARTWNTTSTRTGALMPDYCKEGSPNPSAAIYPFPATGRGGRQYTVWDPAAQKFDIVDICFSSFHLNFDNDPNNTLYTGSGGGIVGWVNTDVWDKTKDAGAAQGWTITVVDTNGNGRRDAFTDVKEPFDPTKDRRITPGCYGVMPSPVDNSVWCSQTGYPGSLTRIDLGPDPAKGHEAALTEIYYVPHGDKATGASGQGYGPRGMDVDREGVAWVVLSSGQLASFDRRKCKGPLNGPKAHEGYTCNEGWTFYAVPGPKYQGDVDAATADSNYYNWSDKFNSLGLGENVQIATSNQGGALLALVNGKWVVLRVPYPLGYYNKSINGRIDDANTGWKGRGLWTGWGNRNPWHNEGDKRAALAVHMQMRPNPLAH